MKRTFLSPQLLLSLLLGTGTLSAQLYDFNHPGSLTNDFHGAGGGWTESPSGGIGDTGQIITTNSTTATSLVLKEGFQISNGESATLSINFQWQTPSSGNGTLFILGIGPSEDYAPWTGGAGNTGNTSDQQLSVGLARVVSSSGIRLITSSVADGNNTNNFSSTLGEPASGTWMYLSATYTRNASNLTITSTLYMADPLTGSPVDHAILTDTRTYSNSALADGSLYAFFATNSQIETRGLVGIDNFYVSAIPEPSTWAIMLAPIFSLLIYRCKRLRQTTRTPKIIWA